MDTFWKNRAPDSSAVTEEHQNDAPLVTELTMAMDEVELLIAYLSRNGKSPKAGLINELLTYRQRFAQGEPLCANAEASFWEGYKLLVQAVQPATVVSIQETNPTELWRKRFPKIVEQVTRVPVLYGTAIFILISLTVMLQTYSMIGAGVLQKTHELFAERNSIRAEIQHLKRLQKISPNNEQAAQLLRKQQNEARLDQEFDANRSLLYRWNVYWQLGGEMQMAFSRYDDFLYSQSLHDLGKRQSELTTALAQASDDRQYRSADITVLQQALTDNHDEIVAVQSARALDESRNRFFRERLSAVYVVNLLEQYVLPLLYGCLGAFTLVLRSIHRAFQLGTFTLRSCMDFNIRIVLGGVAGISSGMFFGDSAAVPSGEFTPMLIAFVVGYNVEILFAVMDDLAERLSISRNEDNSDAIADQRSDGCVASKHVKPKSAPTAEASS